LKQRGFRFGGRWVRSRLLKLTTFHDRFSIQPTTPVTTDASRKKMSIDFLKLRPP
jgi:hypothetical protein